VSHTTLTRLEQSYGFFYDVRNEDTICIIIESSDGSGRKVHHSTIKYLDVKLSGKFILCLLDQKTRQIRLLSLSYVVPPIKKRRRVRVILML